MTKTTEFNMAKFIEAEEIQASAYAAERKQQWKKAMKLHLQAETAFRKIGEISRSVESEMSVDRIVDMI